MHSHSKFPLAGLFRLALLMLLLRPPVAPTSESPDRAILVVGFVFQFMADRTRSFPSGAATACSGVMGPLAGLRALQMPLYLIRGMGAGDVKLLAMVGVWVGPLPALTAALLTMLAVACSPSVSAIWQRGLGKVLSERPVHPDPPHGEDTARGRRLRPPRAWPLSNTPPHACPTPWPSRSAPRQRSSGRWSVVEHQRHHREPGPVSAICPPTRPCACCAAALAADALTSRPACPSPPPRRTGGARPCSSSALTTWPPSCALISASRARWSRRSASSCAPRQTLIEVIRRGQHEADVQFDLTIAGRARAADWMARNSYAGAAPVPLDVYRDCVSPLQAQSVPPTTLPITVAQVRSAFADLVVPPRAPDRPVRHGGQLGRPMLLYGPPARARPLAEHLGRPAGRRRRGALCHHVHGEVIRVSRPTGARAGGRRLPARSLDNRARPDARWMTCERPCVISGGELTLDMLDLSFDARAGYYQAPPHLKANNGIFIVDDLGRQRSRRAN